MIGAALEHSIGLRAGRRGPAYRQPQLVTAFGMGASSFKLRGQARRVGLYIQVLAWNGTNTTMPVAPGGWTALEARTGTSMAGLLCGKFYADGDPLSFDFANATRVLYQAWQLVDPATPVASFLGRTQNTGLLTLTYPALTRANASRGTIFTRASGIRQNTPQVLPAGWHTDTSTGNNSANLRWLSPDAGPLYEDLVEDTVTLATNVQCMSWSIEMLGRDGIVSYPWARAPAGGSFLAIGDSITAATGDLSYHERAFARGINLARNAGYNQGHSGWTSSQLRNQGSVVQTYGPSVVVLMIGTNDPTNGVDLATSQDNIRFLIDAFNGYGCQVVLGTVLPNTNGQELHRRALNNWIRQQVDVVVWDNNATGFDPAIHTGDGTHPNVLGADLLGADLYGLVNPLAAAA